MATPNSKPDIHCWSKEDVKEWATELFDEETGKKFEGQIKCNWRKFYG